MSMARRLSFAHNVMVFTVSMADSSNAKLYHANSPSISLPINYPHFEDLELGQVKIIACLSSPPSPIFGPKLKFYLFTGHVQSVL